MTKREELYLHSVKARFFDRPVYNPYIYTTSAFTMTCRNGYINVIQLNLCDIQGKWNNALKAGLKSAKCLYRKVNILTKYINVLKEYTAFIESPTQATKLIFVDTSNESHFEELGMQVTNIGAFGFIATKTSAEDIAQEFYDFVFTDTTLINTIGLEISLVGNIVYLWHYNADTISYFGDGFVTKEDITNNPNEILDTLNCQTYSEICSLIKHGLALSGGSC